MAGGKEQVFPLHSSVVPEALPINAGDYSLMWIGFRDPDVTVLKPLANIGLSREDLLRMALATRNRTPSTDAWQLIAGQHVHNSGCAQGGAHGDQPRMGGGHCFDDLCIRT